MILVPLFLAILQLGLDLYVRNTLAACAQDAARYAADEDIDTRGADVIQQAAHDRAGSCIDDSLSGRFSADITGFAATMRDSSGSSVDAVEVDVVAPMPIVGFLNLGNLQLRVTGHALQEHP
jgi:hypothetical protein